MAIDQEALQFSAHCSTADKHRAACLIELFKQFESLLNIGLPSVSRHCLGRLDLLRFVSSSTIGSSLYWKLELGGFYSLNISLFELRCRHFC